MAPRHHEDYDLRALLTLLTKQFAAVDEIYVFGSRRYLTGSPRSDADLLVKTTSNIRATDLRSFALENGPALDLFLVQGATATSCANDSHVSALSFADLVSKLDAVRLWNRTGGFDEAPGVEWTFQIPLGVDFTYTVLNSGVPFGWTWGWAQSRGRYFKEIEKEGLPTAPYIGGSISEVTDFLESLIRRLPSMSPSPVAKAKGMRIELRDEYDFQAIFYACVKPWLPQLAREQLTAYFDGNKKNADFHLFDDRVVLEFKCISDTNSKNAVAKTLEGLKSFYKRNANVRELMIIILVLGAVDLDAARWEEEFGNRHDNVRVRVVVVRHAPPSSGTA